MSGTIRADILDYLRDRTALTAYVTSPNAAIRIYFSRVPKSNPPLANFPCVVFRRNTGGHLHQLDEDAACAGYAAPLFEFHVMGIDAVVVQSICEELRLALYGYQGVMGASTIDQCLLEDEVDDVIETKIGDDTFIYRTTQFYKIGHQEAVPTFS